MTSPQILQEAQRNAADALISVLSEIGLIKREIFSEGAETVTMREVWDIRTPGCPLIAVRLSPFGKDENVSIIERLVTYGRFEPRPPVTNGHQRGAA